MSSTFIMKKIGNECINALNPPSTQRCLLDVLIHSVWNSMKMSWIKEKRFIDSNYAFLSYDFLAEIESLYLFPPSFS